MYFLPSLFQRLSHLRQLEMLKEKSGIFVMPMKLIRIGVLQNFIVFLLHSISFHLIVTGKGLMRMRKIIMTRRMMFL